MKRFLLLPGLCLGSLLSAAETTTTYVGIWDDPTWGNDKSKAERAVTTIVGGEVKEKPGKIQVIFKMVWDGEPKDYTGWMTPADKDGKIDGWVDAGGDMYTYVFKGTLKDGVLKADYFNVSDDSTKCGNFDGKLAKDKGAKDNPAKKDGEAKPKKAAVKPNEDGKAPDEKAPGE